MQDRQFPLEHNLSYDNYLVAIKCSSGSSHWEYNFVFSDGTYTNYTNNQPLTQVPIQDGVITTVVMWYSGNFFIGLELIDNNNKCLYKPLYSNYNDYTSKSYVL